MADPVFYVGLEIAAGSLTNVCSHVTRFSFERAIANISSPLRPEPATIELDNDGEYAPRVGAPDLVPGRIVQITATYAGSSYPLFFGRLSRINVVPRKGLRQITVLEAVSDADRLARTMLTTELFTQIKASSLFAEIMTRADVNSFATNTSRVTDTIPYASYRDLPALDAAQQLIESGYYQMFIDGAGTVQLKSRYFGADSAALAIRDEFFDMSYTLDPEMIVNDLKINTIPRNPVSAVNTVAILGGTVTIPGSGYGGFWLTFQDPGNGNEVAPVSSIVTPVGSTDYFVSTLSGGGGVDRTSTISLNMTMYGSTAVVSLFNGSPDTVYLSRFQLRGYPLRGYPTGFSYSSNSSQLTYGVRGMEIANALIQNYTFLRDLCRAIVEDRGSPEEMTTATLVNDWPLILDAEVGDVLTLVNTATGVNSAWTIQNMQHEIDLSSGVRHEVKYGTNLFGRKPWLILDHATAGKLDNGRILAL